MTLNKVLPNSLIYVFTDAWAKDMNKLNDIIKLVQRKNCKVLLGVDRL